MVRRTDSNNTMRYATATTEYGTTDTTTMTTTLLSKPPPPPISICNNENNDRNNHDYISNDSINNTSTNTTTIIHNNNNNYIPSITREFYNSNDIDTQILYMCALYTLLYMIIAIVAYTILFEHWTIIDSIYFAVATFTTVGYGDLQPSTESGQLFTILFALYGVLILGIFIGVIGRAICERQVLTLEHIKHNQQKQFLTYFMESPTSTSTSRPPLYRRDVSDDEKVVSTTMSFWNDHCILLRIIVQVIRNQLPQIIIIILLAFILGYREGWTLTSTMYFTLMSASTTGYGDYTPHTQVDKLYCIFFLPLSVAVFGEILGRVAATYIQCRHHRSCVTKFVNRSLTLCDIRRMDTNHDDKVDIQEFVFFMLVALQKCDQEDIDELKTIFHSLDKNKDGTLDKNDLMDRAQYTSQRHFHPE